MDIRLQLVAIDCGDPLALARFYGALLGRDLAPLAPDEDPERPQWVDLEDLGGVTIAFQRVEHPVAPTWPEGPVPQQMHLDLAVDDPAAAEARVLALGARLATHQPGRDFRVLIDPAGHPFCLVKA